MSLKAAISMVDQLEADGIIGRYAIGGAVAATCYTEPVSAADVALLFGQKLDMLDAMRRLAPIREARERREVELAKRVRA